MPFLFLEDLPNPLIEPMSLASPALAGKLFTTNANCKVKPINLSQTTYLPVWFNVDHIFVIVVVFFFLLTCICLNNSVLIYFKRNSPSPNWRGICAKTGFPWWLHRKNLLAMQETRIATLSGKIPWRRKWPSTAAFLLGKSDGQRRPVGHKTWGHKESGVT